jgi:hypothetical protein
MNGTTSLFILSENANFYSKTTISCFLSFVETKGKQNKTTKNKVIKVKGGLTREVEGEGKRGNKEG